MENAQLESQDLAPLREAGVRFLPDWKKVENPFEKISGLNTNNDVKNTIILWWKENPEILEKLAELRQVSTSINLPKNEAREVVSVFDEALTRLKVANEGLLTFISEKKKDETLFKKVVKVYATAYGLSHDVNEAKKVSQAVSEFNESEETMELTIAVAKAIIETRGKNPDENKLRKKAAQSVFQEMFDQMAIARVASVNDIDFQVSNIIDSPKVEKIDLTSAFLAEPWTGNERRKMLRNYNKLKRVLNNLEADTEYKTGLTTLWRWANGKLPKDSSVFKILRHADELDEGITDVVAEAWQNEADQKEDEEEREE